MQPGAGLLVHMRQCRRGFGKRCSEARQRYLRCDENVWLLRDVRELHSFTAGCLRTTEQQLTLTGIMHLEKRYWGGIFIIGHIEGRSSLKQTKCAVRHGTHVFSHRRKLGGKYDFLSVWKKIPSILNRNSPFLKALCKNTCFTVGWAHQH